MTKTRWKIYTEHVNLHHIRPIVDKYFDGYSLFAGMGVWEGNHERCIVIEIISLELDDEVNVIAVCREINTINHQQCCLVTSEQVDVMLVSKKKQPT